MATLSRHQLRAARVLLVLNQEDVAALAGVGITTIRKFENGHRVTPRIQRALRSALEAEGAVLVDPGTVVGGIVAGDGVVLRSGGELPPGTRRRIAEVDRVPDPSPDAGRTNRRRGKGAPVPTDGT